MEKRFLKSIGFNVSPCKTLKGLNKAIRSMWVVFDCTGHVKCLKTCGNASSDFKYVSRHGDDCLETYLKENHLYAHALVSFFNRGDVEFYQKKFIDMLKVLGWEVENDQLSNLAW